MMLVVLTEQKWGCSWRYAGGIIADIREQGGLSELVLFRYGWWSWQW